MAAYGCLVGLVATTLGNGGEIRLDNLGTFGVKARAARQGRNPQTGEAITIAAGKKVHFNAAKALKDSV